MKRFAIILFSALFLLIAYVSKPDDKKCIVEVVTAVWGPMVPSEEKPMYYDQFMDLNSQQVEINDWFFLKRIRYDYGNKIGVRTVGIGAFNKVFTF